jgi:hypothetical protein
MMNLYMVRREVVPPIRSNDFNILQGVFLRINRNTVSAMFTQHEECGRAAIRISCQSYPKGSRGSEGYAAPAAFPSLKILIDLEFEQMASFCVNIIVHQVTHTFTAPIIKNSKLSQSQFLRMRLSLLWCLARIGLKRGDFARQKVMHGVSSVAASELVVGRNPCKGFFLPMQATTKQRTSDAQKREWKLGNCDCKVGKFRSPYLCIQFPRPLTSSLPSPNNI